MLKTLHEGEKPIENAPSIKLKNGENCIPQHFLQYKHTLDSVQKIILSCEYDERYPIFVCRENETLFIQIGIIGHDNYKSLAAQTRQKIVYGRLWKVECNLPTSEIVQTVFLALKKAREHEIRELFRLTISKGTATPFNNHHDLPLMANNMELLANDESTLTSKEFETKLRMLVSNIYFKDSALKIKNIETRANNQTIVDMSTSYQLNEYVGEKSELNFTVLLEKNSLNEFLFCLMDKFISISDREIEERFKYKGFPRFSRKLSVVEIAELSIDTRNNGDMQNEQFLKTLEKVNYQTDRKRAPVIESPHLSRKILKHLSKFGELDGFQPEIISS